VEIRYPKQEPVRVCVSSRPPVSLPVLLPA